MKSEYHNTVQEGGTPHGSLAFLSSFQQLPVQVGSNRHTMLFLVSGFLLLLVSLGCVLLPSSYMMLALFVIAGISILALLRPQLALLLTFACAGLPSLLFPLPGHNLHLVEPAVVFLLLVVGLRRPIAHIGPPHVLAVLFLALAFISFAHVPEFSTNGSIYGADKRLLALLVIFVAFFCGSFLSTEVWGTTTLLATILLVSLPLYIIGFMQALGLHPVPLLEARGAINPHLAQGRLWGPFPWSVNFGMYLGNLLAIAVVCWLRGKQRCLRLFGCVMTIATVLEIIGSGTRSAALAAAVITIIAFIITRRFKLLLCTLALVSIASYTFLNKVQILFTHDATSTDNRLLIWRAALTLIHNNLWLGIGLQQFHYYYAQLVVGQAAQLGVQGIHPHEQYLEWALESGILWPVTGALLLLSILFSCARAYRIADDAQRSLLLAALLAIVSTIIIGFFDAPLDQLEGSVFLFLLAGLAVGYAETRPSKKAGQLFCKQPAPPVTERNVKHELLTRQKGQAQEGDISIRTPVTSTGLDIMTRGAYTEYRCSEQVENSSPDTHKTGRAIVLQLLSWSIPLPCIFFTTVLLTRYLGPIQYGEYSLTFPFLTLFALVSGTGMDQVLIRQLSRQPRGAWGMELSYALGTRLVSTLLSAGTAVIVACLLPIAVEQRILFLLGSVALLFSFSFNGVRIIFSHGFRVEQRVGFLSLLESVNRLFTAGLMGLVVLLHLSLVWAYVLLVYTDLPMFLIQAYVASKRFGICLRFSWARFRAHMLGGLALLGHQTLVLLAGQVDLGILMMLSGLANVGTYALASRLIDPLIAIANAYTNGLYPLFCTTFIEDRERFTYVVYRAMRILALAVIPLAVAVNVAAGTIVSMLGGQHFSQATGAVQLLIWAMVATFLNLVGERACTAAQMEKRIPFVTAASTIINIFANLVLVPRWSITGAALATLMSEGIALCLYLFLLGRCLRVAPLIAMLFLVGLANLPAWLFLYWQRTLPLALALPAAFLLTFVIYLVGRLLVRQDVITIRRMLLARQQNVPVHSSIATTDTPGTQTSLSPDAIADCPTRTFSRIHIFKRRFS